MQRLVALVAFALVLLPSALAHAPTPEEPMGHITVKPMTLEAGQSQNFSIIPGRDEGPWRAGDVFILYFLYFSQPQPVSIQLVFNHTEVIQDWLVTGTEPVHYRSSLMPYDAGPYELVLSNPSDETQVKFFWYFDQTCSCSMKPIPLSHGWVVFQYDLRPGKAYDIGVPLAEDWKVTGKLARRTGDDARWPDDFEILDEATAEAPGWVNFTVRPESEERLYLVLFEERGTSFEYNGTPVPIYMTPYIEDAKATPTGTPAPAFAMLVCVALAAAALRRARRG